LNILRARVGSETALRRAIMMASLLARAGWMESASARRTIPHLGAGNAPAAPLGSGRWAFCGVIRASTSCSLGPSHWPGRIFSSNCRRLQTRLASPLPRRNRRNRGLQMVNII